MARERSIKKTARNSGAAATLRDWRVVLVFAGMAAIFFFKILLGNAWLWEDMLYFSYPVRVFAATSIAQGHLPLWNPYTFNGMPFLADIQTAVFYLPSFVLALFVRDGGLNFYWLEVMVIAHYVLAGWAMYLLASSFGMKRAPAVFAGVTYMLSGFMIMHAIHQQIITMVAWYPLIVFLFRKALTEQGWRCVFLCALVLGHSTFAGYPQLSLYTHFFLFAYFLFLLLNAHRGSALLSHRAFIMTAKAGIIVGLGLAIGAIQLLPTSELADLSQRAQITYEKSTEGSLAWRQLLTLLFPKLFGTAGGTGFNYWGPGPYWHYWETCIYLGVLPLMLVALSIIVVRRKTDASFFWGVILFTLLFAFGDNFFLYKLFFEYVPGFAKFRNPARMGIFFSLSASILAGFTLQELKFGERKPHTLRLVRSSVFGITGIGVLFWIALVSGTLDSMLAVPKNPEAVAAMHKSAHLTLVLLLASGGTIVVLTYGNAWSGRVAMFFPVIFFLDMFIFGADQNNATLNPGDYFSRSAPMVRFLRNDLKSGLFRVNTRNQYGMIMDRNQGMVDRIFTMEGYTPLVLQRALMPLNDTQAFDLLNVKYKTVFDQNRGTLSLALHPSYMPRAFLLYDVCIARTEQAMLTILRDTTWNHRRTAILEKDPPLRAVSPADSLWGSARIIAYDDNRIDLEVTTPEVGVLVLSEIYYPGWNAYIDGTETEVLRTDYNLRGISVPRGTHNVVFRFVPPSFIAGSWITAVALLLCLAGIAAPTQRRARLQEDKH